MNKAAQDYFLFISKLEYALKNSGFVTIGRKDSAMPDWEKFIIHVHKELRVDTVDADIRHFLDSPPKKQLYKDGNIYWSSPEKIKDSDTREMLQACLSVRNNLFHGGKHGDGNSGRNEILIRAATKILHNAVEACPLVKQWFDMAEL
ncbi:MAG: hypothetical protein LRZ85_08510 [Alphaproteobacteria bacterium]|nr:hypothetical protein [Alphaproteobacteria bacterium]